MLMKNPHLNLMNKILSNKYDNKEYGVFHNRLIKALYIFSLVFYH
jgi:hypothetical protein